QKLFQLRDEQLFYSRSILQQYGNISSATLPHMWQAICNDPKIVKNTKVISMAFGPGLTIAGMIGEKL
ncbi:MAG TPA: 3-oxoacyl-[acyl-carrier-protein] synthase III C-terminal domain-containing protein, partial [Chlamydiales bacterium]|nr:3-oxoacyl-[acyl-carrier-protein] synthase III C-terminal domain-containing protein [Chlamydiales bacterium]